MSDDELLHTNAPTADAHALDDNELLFDDEGPQEVSADELVSADDVASDDEVSDDQVSDDEVVISDDDDATGEVEVASFDPDEALRLDVYHGLVHCICSNTALWSTVDVAEVKHVVEAGIAMLPLAPLTLEPLWQYMLAKGTPRDEAASTILLFHSRAPRWNVEMVLPHELAALDDAAKANAVDALRARGVTTGTSIKKAPGALRDDARPRARKVKAKKAGSKASRFSTTSPAKKRIGVAVRVGLAIGLVAAIAARVHVSSEEKNVARSLGALCSSVEMRGHAALCVATEDVLHDAAHAKERADVVDEVLGVRVLFVNANGEVLPL